MGFDVVFPGDEDVSRSVDEYESKLSSLNREVLIWMMKG